MQRAYANAGSRIVYAPTFQAQPIALEQFSVADTLAFFSDLGLETVTEPDGKIYPRSNTANSVLDVLRYALEHPRLHLLPGDGVADLRKKGSTFSVTFTSGEKRSDINKVILACGGAAGSKVGGGERHNDKSTSEP